MIAILNADARHIPLSDESVNCVVTSPPYWGLRDYGTAKWEGGDIGCDHHGKQVPRRDSESGQGAPFANSRGVQASKAFEIPWRAMCGK